MKRNLLPSIQGLAAAALLVCAANLAVGQTTNYYVNAFTSAGNAQDVTAVGCGNWYASDSVQLWDGTTPDTLAGPGDYSCYVSMSLNQQNCLTAFFCATPGDNLWWDSSPVGVPLSQYKAIHFDVLWDTVNSAIPIDQFNNVSIWPADLLQSWAPTNYMAGSEPYSDGLEVDVAGLGAGSGGEPAFLGNVDIPDAASNGWVSITLPIDPTLPNIDEDSAGAFTNGASGIYLKKYINQPWGELGTNNVVYFWIGNIWFEGEATPPPPPILQLPGKTTPGLNVFASTAGNTYFDRQEVALVASNGVSWVGNATAGNPVTYSFTINGFPQSPATANACEAYLMMAPNPAYYDNAIDWNETNCVIIWLQQATNGTTLMSFTSKVNDPGDDSADQLIGTVTNNGTALGTWSVTFTSDTQVTMTAPNGNTSSFVFTDAPYFAETADPGMYLYLGMQANNAASLNQAVCYSNFSLSGVPAAMSDNFLTDSNLNANLWFNFMADGPAGVFVMPPNAEYWLTWNIPAAGFHLQTASNIMGPWTALNDDLVIPGVGEDYQLVTTNDVPLGTAAAFFDMANP
ncbi:MAG TPA: hypothetical protein VMF08_08375 [Candidatus Sulfotelmatobacter sp.]|nr:hypothetical protein [Candidatus Sulfotelmatobacter sp.]